MSRPSSEADFLTRNVFNPSGDGRRIFEVGVRCRCGREAWSPAKNPGWGRRIFKEAGWSIGSRLSQHRCPECVAGRRHPEPEARPSATIHQLPLRDLSPACPDLPPTPAPKPELPPLPAMPLSAPSPVREIPRTPTAIEEEPMAQTALAEALRPLKEKHERKAQTKGARGKPSGYASEDSAYMGALRVCRKLGIAKPRRDEHYRVVKEENGTFGYVLINSAAEKPAPDNKTLRIREGQPTSKRENAERNARLALMRAGIARPMENVHYSISGSWRDGYVYKFLPAAGKVAAPLPNGFTPRTSGGGHLSRFDAKKDALGVLQQLRKEGGAPVEGVDYWITQDGYNLWGWNTTGPEPAVAEAEKPEPECPATIPTPVEAPKAEEPRKATPADNRRIMEKLDECYSVNGQAYFAGWSDAAVAEKLAIPRAWVAKVREEFYGPEHNPEAEIQQKIAKLDDAIGRAAALLAKEQSLLDALAEVETLVAELRKVRAEVAR